MSDTRKTITFPVNKHGWVLLFEILGKKILTRAQRIKRKPNKQPFSDEHSQHRVFQVESEGGTRVCPKSYDISDFVK